MEQHDDYISGRHHYWFQFAGGFIFGAVLGAGLSYGFFDSARVVVVVTVVIAFSFAFFCGRWGERAWRSISNWFGTWFRAL